MRFGKSLVKKRAAFFLRYAGGGKKAQVGRLLVKAIQGHIQLRQQLISQLLFCRQIVQAAAVAFGKFGHEASPTFRINSSIRA